MNITAADVNKLRKSTGAGMMDCKAALIEAEGDFDKAIDVLRKKGQKVAGKRADKDASEGAVVALTSSDSKRGVALMLNCETDFVGKNQEFVDFTKELTQLALNNKHESVESLLEDKLSGVTVIEKINEMVGKVGEKIEIGGFGVVAAERVVSYIHPGNRLATVVGFNKADFQNAEEVCKQVAMQTAAMAPIAVDKADVSAEILEKEKEIAIDIARNEGKPESIIEKIAEGRVNKFLQENTLLNQDYIGDNKKTVDVYLKEVDANLTVTKFVRLMLTA